MLPFFLASLVALLGFVAVLVMAVGERRDGRVGLYGLILFGVALALVLGMLLSRPL